MASLAGGSQLGNRAGSRFAQLCGTGQALGEGAITAEKRDNPWFRVAADATISLNAGAVGSTRRSCKRVTRKERFRFPIRWLLV